MTATSILLKFVSDEPDCIDQVFMTVTAKHWEGDNATTLDHATKYATEVLGECHLDAWAELSGGNCTDTDFDEYRCFTG